jgi:hypothetical protein
LLGDVFPEISGILKSGTHYWGCKMCSRHHIRKNKTVHEKGMKGYFMGVKHNSKSALMYVPERR